MDTSRISQRLYFTAMLAVVVMVGLTVVGLWQATHPVDKGQVESWQPVTKPAMQIDDVQAQLVEPTPTTGVAGVSVSRPSVDAPMVSSPAESTPTPTPTLQVTMVPVVIQPVACALGPTPLPQGGHFCQPQK